MSGDLKKVIYYAEIVYKKIVETLFELNDIQHLISKKVTSNNSYNSSDKLFEHIRIQLNIIQNMLDTLKEALAGVGIYTDILRMPDDFLKLENHFLQEHFKCTKNTNKIMLIKDKLEELKKHIENVVYLVEIMENGEVANNSGKKENEIKKAITFGKEVLLEVRVVEGKLDVITDCRPLVGTIHLHGIETYQQIKELFAISEELSSNIKRFEILLEKLDISEKLEFSMEGPLENTQNYILMLLMPELRIRTLLMEKYEQIREVRKKIEKLIERLNSCI